MPIYEYACESCGERFEKLVRMNADSPVCPSCASAEVRKLISQSGFILKGGGWYKDHYGLKKSSSDSAPASSESAAPAASSESGSSTPKSTAAESSSSSSASSSDSTSKADSKTSTSKGSSKTSPSAAAK